MERKVIDKGAHSQSKPNGLIDKLRGEKYGLASNRTLQSQSTRSSLKPKRERQTRASSPVEAAEWSNPSFLGSPDPCSHGPILFLVPPNHQHEENNIKPIQTQGLGPN